MDVVAGRKNGMFWQSQSVGVGGGGGLVCGMVWVKGFWDEDQAASTSSYLHTGQSTPVFENMTNEVYLVQVK